MAAVQIDAQQLRDILEIRVAHSSDVHRLTLDDRLSVKIGQLIRYLQYDDDNFVDVPLAVMGDVFARAVVRTTPIERIAEAFEGAGEEQAAAMVRALPIVDRLWPEVKAGRFADLRAYLATASAMQRRAVFATTGPDYGIVHQLVWWGNAEANAILHEYAPVIDLRVTTVTRRRTALHVAAERGNTETARLLLDASVFHPPAQTDVADDDGRYACDLCPNDNPELQALCARVPLSDAQHEALAALVQEQQRHRLADLHTHLLGMGDAVFWIDTIMRNVLVHLAVSMVPLEHYVAAPTHADWHLVHGVPLQQHVTRDVVYDKRTLLEAFSEHRVDALSADDINAHVANLMGKFRSSGGTPLSELMQKHTVFNARMNALEQRDGLTNTILVDALKAAPTGPLRCLLESAFEMQDDPIGDRFHDKFTPQFYPRRYALKDAMYSQYPVVLDRLLDYVLER